MKILIFKTFPLSLKDWDELGLIERELDLFKYLFKKNEIEFSILTYGNEKDKLFQTKSNPIKIYPTIKNKFLKKNILFKYIYSLFIPFIHKTELKKYDIYQSNQLWGFWVILLAKFLYKKKVILRQGFDFFDFLKKSKKNKIIIFFLKIIIRITYKYSDVIIVTTPQTKIKIEKEFKVKNKIFVVPNFINTKKFYPNEKSLVEKKILCIGRISKQKNYKMLLEAIKNTNIQLDIYGHGNSSQYESMINENKLNVNFLGNKNNSELPDIYNSYKLFILCSLYEGHPKSLLEALACGCNCIGTNVSGIKELHSNGNFDLVNLNTLELKNKILSIINNSNNKNFNAVNFINKNFTMEVISKKYLEIYKDI